MTSGSSSPLPTSLPLDVPQLAPSPFIRANMSSPSSTLRPDQRVVCPSCSNSMPMEILNRHLDRCLQGLPDPRPATGANGSSGVSSTQAHSAKSPPLPSSQAAMFFTQAAHNGRRKAAAAADLSSTPTPKAKKPKLDSDSLVTGTKSEPKEEEKIGPSVWPSTPHAPSSVRTDPGPSTARSQAKDRMDAVAPLAERLRPTSLDDFVGQQDVVNGPLRSLLKQGRVPSMILWGPPGTGKTTLARIVARSASSASSSSSKDDEPGMATYRFVEISATSTGAVDIKRISDEAMNRLQLSGGRNRTLLFVDEIQRWNRGVQDHLLPGVEKGILTVIGATTENPSFRLQNALLSRMRVFVLSKLSVDECFEVLRRARARASAPADAEDASVGQSVMAEARAANCLDDDMLRWLATNADGDARSALNALELAIATVDPALSSQDNLASVKGALKKTALQYDRSGDHHYDTISALHKSIRGSDADAAMYWLMRMLESGDDPLFVARRLIVAASEDCNSLEALQMATATYQACNVVGMPECAENLASCVLYLAESKKSTRAYRGMKKARALIQEQYNFPVPLHIRNAPTKLMKELDYGKEYRYEPSFAHPVHQEYFPKELKGTRLLSPPPEDWTRPEGDGDASQPQPLRAVPSGSVALNGASATDASTLNVAGKPLYWKPSDKPAAADESLRLRSADGIGPGSCQRVFQIGARGVDLDLLEEWERERNDGKPWAGRERMLRELRRRWEGGIEDALNGEGEGTEGAPAAPSSEAPETTTNEAESSSKSAPTERNNDTASSSSTPPRAASGRRKGRFILSPDDWKPEVDVFPSTKEGKGPGAMHAVILLNQPILASHLPRFARLWNAARCRICADGGANRILQNGELMEGVELPHLIVGDLDSVTSETLAWFEAKGVQVRRAPSQYATDLQKSVQAVEDLERDEELAQAVLSTERLPFETPIIVYGGLSGRLDHTAHTMHVLWQMAIGVETQLGVEDPGDDAEDRRGGKLRKRRKTWVVSEDSLAFVLPKGYHMLHLPLERFGKTCGLLPIGTGPSGVRIKTKGLEWDLDGSTPSYIGGFLSTSNHVVSPRVEVTTEREIVWTVELRPEATAAAAAAAAPDDGGDAVMAEQSSS